MTILHPKFPGNGDIHPDRVNAFKRSELGGVIILMDDSREPEWLIPNAQWDEFCRDAFTSIERRERESRDRD